MGRFGGGLAVFLVGAAIFLAGIFFDLPHFGLLAVVVPLLLIVGRVAVPRLILRTAYGPATLRASSPVVRGGPVDLDIQVVPKRGLRPSAVEWELAGEETAILCGTTSDTTYTHAFARVQDVSRQPEPWHADRPVSLRARLVVPASAPPSFSAANHSLRWWAIARVKAAGLPTLTVRESVDVVMAEATVALPEDARTELVVSQAGLRGELNLRLPPQAGAAIVQSGGRLRGRLMVQVLQTTDARQTVVRLLRLLHGSGTAEEWAGPGKVLHLGPLRAGQAFEAALDWTLPPTAELSYAGRHLKCDWLVDVQVDRPRTSDWHLRFPLVMWGRDQGRAQ